ncbi:hypothetical protein JZ751_013373 [Albula glossodonta]|uniref:Ig-like domain-containing protein n=1 Tax=Albula glossodonta TaxID=121402 RepID=A0A8T2MLZ3_9TELE|nr:hypothetical protein JZ751_013373 [Albula glossodonta]
MRHSQGDTPTLLCLSTNTVGNSSLQLLVPPVERFSVVFSIGLLVIGILAGALVTGLLWGNPPSETGENVYDNQTMVSGRQRGGEENGRMETQAQAQTPVMMTRRQRDGEEHGEAETQTQIQMETQSQAADDSLHYASVTFSARTNKQESSGAVKDPPQEADSPPKPKLTPVKVEVTEGSSVNLSCSAAAPFVFCIGLLVIGILAGALVTGLLWGVTQCCTQRKSRLNENTVPTSDQSDNDPSTLNPPPIAGENTYDNQTIVAGRQRDGEEHGEAETQTQIQTETQSQAADDSLHYASVTFTTCTNKQESSGAVKDPPQEAGEGENVLYSTVMNSSNANPPVQSYTWYKVNGTEMNTVGTGQKLTFSVTPSDSEQYHCEAQNQHGMEKSPIALLDISGSGSCSRTAAEISCSCESRGNPSPSMEWRVSGLRVTNSTDRVIREEQLGNTGLRSSLTMHHSQGDTPTLLCYFAAFVC